MEVSRGAFWSRWGWAGVAGVLAGVLGLGLSPAHAGTTSASITGFVPNPFGPNGPGGRYVRTGSWQDVFGKAMATAEYTAPAAGAIVTGTATMVAADAAGSAVVSFCVANPLVCATGAAAAWFAMSRISYDEPEDKWKKDESQFGPCYTTRNGWNGGTDYASCHTTVNAAINEHVAILNSTGAGDGDYVTETRQRTWSGVVAPCTPALNSSCQVRYTWSEEYCVKATGQCGTRNSGSSGDEETLYRRPDSETFHRRDASEFDFAQHTGAFPPNAGVLNQVSPPDGIPVENPTFKPATAPLGQPYSGDATPNEGPWKQDTVTTWGDPNNPPLGLEWGTGTRDADNPNTEEDEAPEPDPDNPDGGGPGDNGAEYPDLCEEHPNISACQPLGDAPTDEVPKSTFNMMFQAEPLGLPAGCPTPISVLGHSLSFETACTISNWMAPLVTALGAMVAAMICIAAIRGS